MKIEAPSRSRYVLRSVNRLLIWTLGTAVALAHDAPVGWQVDDVGKSRDALELTLAKSMEERDGAEQVDLLVAGHSGGRLRFVERSIPPEAATTEGVCIDRSVPWTDAAAPCNRGSSPDAG